jgi:hypothetical protein
MRTNDDYRATNPADEFLGPGPNKREPRIITRFVYPPIADRRFDYSSVTEDYDGPGSPIGYGATREAAIRDLLDQFEE